MDAEERMAVRTIGIGLAVRSRKLLHQLLFDLTPNSKPRTPNSLDFENDFAEVTVLFHITVGIGCLRQRKDPIDDGLDATGS